MSTAIATEEDFQFFDFLAPYRWPELPRSVLGHFRQLVATGEIQIETVLENTLAKVSGKYTRVAEDANDLSDGSEVKKVVSQFRCNDHGRDSWMNSFKVSNTRNKTGLLRVLAYSKYQKKFYFFAIPKYAYGDLPNVEIILDRSTGYREPVGIPRGKWARYQVEDFVRLATITEREALRL